MRGSEGAHGEGGTGVAPSKETGILTNKFREFDANIIIFELKEPFVDLRSDQERKVR
jgi:hypothetical protein